MQTNNKIEKPTRMASARAMLLVLALPSRPSFIMKKSAEAKLPRMAMKTMMTKYFMNRIIV